MDTVVDFPALALALSVSLLIAVAQMWADRAGPRRGWLVSLALAVALVAISLLDLIRETPRQTHMATAIVGGTLPVLGALGLVRATRRVRVWIRWPLVFASTFVLVFAAVLIGAALVPRILR